MLSCAGVSADPHKGQSADSTRSDTGAVVAVLGGRCTPLSVAANNPDDRAANHLHVHRGEPALTNSVTNCSKPPPVGRTAVVAPASVLTLLLDILGCIGLAVTSKSVSACNSHSIELMPACPSIWQSDSLPVHWVPAK